MDQQRFAAAAAFAIERHAGQKRKGTQVPYVTHPLAVAEALVYYYPDSDDLIVAGLCHDLVEDGKATAAELTDRFGSRVAQLVAAVTKPRGGSWQEAADATLEHLRRDDLEVVRLKAADALSNARSILRDSEIIGPAVFERFRGSPSAVAGYYLGMRAIASARLIGEPLAAELSGIVDAIWP